SGGDAAGASATSAPVARSRAESTPLPSSSSGPRTSKRRLSSSAARSMATVYDAPSRGTTTPLSSLVHVVARFFTRTVRDGANRSTPDQAGPAATPAVRIPPSSSVPRRGTLVAYGCRLHGGKHERHVPSRRSCRDRRARLRPALRLQRRRRFLERRSVHRHGQRAD